MNKSVKRLFEEIKQNATREEIKEIYRELEKKLYHTTYDTVQDLLDHISEPNHYDYELIFNIETLDGDELFASAIDVEVNEREGQLIVYLVEEMM